MTDAELDAIEARCRAATSGPWGFRPLVAIESAAREVVGIDWITEDTADLALRDEDGAFIAAARTDVPALVAEVRRLREQVAADTHNMGYMLPALIEERNEAREQRDAARAEVARLSEALDAAARVVRRKAEREAGKEEA
jgi:hypothetical protein